MASEPDKEVEDKFNELLFGVKRSVLYHNRRKTFFTRISKSIAFVSFLFGGTIFVTLISSGPNWLPILISAIIVFLQLIEIVFGIYDKAYLHHDLARRFINLQKDMTLGNADIKIYEAERLEIESDEPPKLSWLDLMCHNELTLSIYGSNSEDIYKIGLFTRLFSSFFDLRAIELIKRD